MSEDADHSPSPASDEVDPASLYPTLEEMARLLPQYEIHRVIGVGGMGAIYLGRQTALDRWVAIKLLPVSAAQNAEDAQRFIKEARSMAKLVHPHIVAVFDFGQTMDGHLYLVMEYVEGSDLHRRTRDGEITPKRARQVIFQLCDALQFAHDRGVAHRDIKPANLLITNQWQVKVADFGLARDLAAIPNSDEPEYGTPDYTAPERLIVGAVVDHRADIYALGVVMHEMLTGKTPHGEEGAEAGKKLPPEFAAVIAKCLLADPDQRYQKASEIKLALSSAMIDPKKAAGLSAAASSQADESEAAPRRTSPLGSLGPVGWGLASVAVVAIGGWLMLRNHVQQQNGGSTGGGAHNTTAGAGNLTVFAPPKPEPKAPAVTEPVKKAEPTPPVPPPTEPAPAKMAEVKKEGEEPLLTAPSVPLDHPYQVPEGDAGEVARMKGHKGSVYSIKLLKDQRRLVSASYDGTVRVWDVLGQNELLRVDAGITAISRLSVSPDEQRILAASYASDKLAIIDIATGKVTATVAVPNDRSSAAIFTSDGHSVLAGATSDAPNLYRWTPDKGPELEPISGVQGWIHDMVALPDDPTGRILLNGSLPTPGQDPKFRRSNTILFAAATGEITPITATWKGAGRFKLSPDGSHLTALGASFFVFDAASLELTATVAILPSPTRPTVAILTGDGKFIVTTWSDNTLRILETGTGAEVYKANIGQRTTDLSLSLDNRWAVLSANRSNNDTPQETDFDLLLWRLPKLDTLVSDQMLEKLAQEQIGNLAANDPELAKLRDDLPQAVKLPSAAEKAAQLQTLNAQYVAALRRKAQSQSPTEQRVLLAEIDMMGVGAGLPHEGMDVSVPQALRDLRGIYRSQLATLEAQQKQATEEARGKIAAYFAPLLDAREKAGDRLGARRVKAVSQAAVSGSATGESSAAKTPGSAATAAGLQTIGTPVKRPDRRCTVVSIARTAKNGYVPSTVPVGKPPVDLGSVVGLTGGEAHAYALLPDGRVRGWGTWSGSEVTTPSEATDVVKLDGNDWATLALRADGKVVAWGPNSPAQVWAPPGGKAPMDICAGANGAGFVLCTDGSIIHTLPPGQTVDNTPPPGLGPVTRLYYVGTSGFCALLRDGNCVFWGMPKSPVTPPPAGVRDAIFLGFSNRYAVAMQKDGLLAGWGDLAQGQRFRVARYNACLAIGHDFANRVFPIHRADHSWELLSNPSTPEYMSEDRVSALEGRLRGCLDAVFTLYHVLALRPQ